MKSDMLNAILSIKSGLERHNKCCHSFEFNEMDLSTIGTNSIYRAEFETNVENKDESTAHDEDSTDSEDITDYYKLN